MLSWETAAGPAGDVAVAVAAEFYQAAFGFAAKFVDDRYAALDAGAVLPA